MKKKKKLFISSFFYTFGTIFFVTIVAVCAMNFAKDGRAFQTPLLSASTVNKAAVEENTETKTLKYNKSTTTTTEKSKSSTNKANKADKADVPQKTTSGVSENNSGNNP